ncbi:hypothetical protein F0562_027654 [Nyssa sinensis]|uniref:Uncharacterized protein n=1 Tax=Nyssa sinensis TaxID=561372 RepID=A0A5J5B648_9ASTE|nr:hypothetical protein F0562_027654 [Nyssa sinensis]
MHVHAKTDSEVTSLAPSSPTRSPRRPVYFVQSPSRDSHDGEKTTTSFHSSPVLSPTGSPPHSHSSVGRHSRESSSSRFSGSLKPGSRKISPNDGSAGRHNRKGQKPWKECDVIEEEGLLEDEGSRKGFSRRCYFLAFVLGFFVLFSVFSLILYGASKPQKPTITMKSITFERFMIQAGSDFTGVSTDMVSMKATVKLTFRNTATFFGVHVTSTPLDLSYSQLTVGTGNIKKFYQSRKSQRSIAVSVIGDKIPLYGSGASLSSSTGTTTVPVPLKLNFVFRSRAYVLGKLVKPKFYKKIECSMSWLCPSTSSSNNNLNPSEIRTTSTAKFRRRSPISTGANLPDQSQHPPYIPPFHVVGFAPGPVPAMDGSDAGVDLQWNYGLEPKKKKLKEQDFLENNSQISSVDFLQPRSVSTGLGLSLDNGRLASSGESPFLALIADDIDRELQRQDAEIDRFLKVQGDRLRQAVLERVQANQVQTISYVEEKVLQKLREKEAEVENIIKKNMELESRMEQLAVEAGAWQQRAKYNENMINTLKFNLQQVYAQGRDSKEGCGDSEVDDTASCCNGRAIDFHLLRKENNEMKELMTCKFQ